MSLCQDLGLKLPDCPSAGGHDLGTRLLQYTFVNYLLLKSIEGCCINTGCLWLWLNKHVKTGLAVRVLGSLATPAL